LAETMATLVEAIHHDVPTWFEPSSANSEARNESHCLGRVDRALPRLVVDCRLSTIFLCRFESNLNVSVRFHGLFILLTNRIKKEENS
jgi:hypothetical protein